MSKNDFKKLMKDTMSDLSLEKQEKLLDNIQKFWIKELKSEIFKNFTKCEHCGQYFKSKQYKKVSKTGTQVETTYSDAGYGDDDRYGEVEYIFNYLECPSCKHQKLIDKEYVRTIWEKRRN